MRGGRGQEDHLIGQAGAQVGCARRSRSARAAWPPGGDGRHDLLVDRTLHAAADRPADEPRGRVQGHPRDIVLEREAVADRVVGQRRAAAWPSARRPRAGFRGVSGYRSRRSGAGFGGVSGGGPGGPGRGSAAYPGGPAAVLRRCGALPGGMPAPGQRGQLFDRVHGGGAAALRARRPGLAICHRPIVPSGCLAGKTPAATGVA